MIKVVRCRRSDNRPLLEKECPLNQGRIKENNDCHQCPLNPSFTKESIKSKSSVISSKTSKIRNNTAEQRRVYELRWKYLQQSDDYRKWLENYSKKYVDWDAWWGTHIEAGDDEKQKHLLKGKGFDLKWTTLYDLMGRINVHTASFDEWWEKKERQLNSYSPIRDYGDFVARDINFCWINTKEDPSSPERFKKQFCEKFGRHIRQSSFLHVVINPDGDLRIIKAVLLRMINQKKKENHTFYRAVRQHDLPIAGKIRIDELEKYLNVFILHERYKKNWKEIISVVSPRYNSEDSETIYEQTRRIHQRYLQKAKTIICNVENGQFPGDY